MRDFGTNEVVVPAEPIEPQRCELNAEDPEWSQSISPVKAKALKAEAKEPAI